MRNLCHIVLIAVLLFGCKRNVENNYRVSAKDSANFSVFISMLYPEEILVVELNDAFIILNDTGRQVTGSPSSYNYFWFPDSIRKISISGHYKDKVTFHKIFKDTLVDVAQRSVFISRPFPKGMTKETYERYGYMPIDSAERKITLEDDHTYFKDTWRY